MIRPDEPDTRNVYVVTADNGKHFIWAHSADRARKIALGSRWAKEVSNVKLLRTGPPLSDDPT